MNKVIMMGRLARDPDVRWSQGAEPLCVARYTLAVDRRRSSNDSQNGQPTADFISCVAMGRRGEFAEKYLHKGTKLVVEGRIQTGSYTNKDGNKVYTTDVYVESQEFAESKAAAGGGNRTSGEDFTGGAAQVAQNPGQGAGGQQMGMDDFMNIPDDMDDFPF